MAKEFSRIGVIPAVKPLEVEAAFWNAVEKKAVLSKRVAGVRDVAERSAYRVFTWAFDSEANPDTGKPWPHTKLKDAEGGMMLRSTDSLFSSLEFDFKLTKWNEASIHLFLDPEATSDKVRKDGTRVTGRKTAFVGAIQQLRGRKFFAFDNWRFINPIISAISYGHDESTQYAFWLEQKGPQ